MTVPRSAPIALSWATETSTLESDGSITLGAVYHELQFDAVTRLVHEGTSVLTEHAVESGAPISDHKRANPRRLTIEGVVTNTPLDVPPPSGYGNSSSVQTTTDTENGQISAMAFVSEFDRISEVSDTLERLRLEATPVAVTTRSRVYEELQIVSVSEPQEAEDGSSARYTIELQEIRVARTRSAAAPVPREPRGQNPRDRGAQGAEDSETRRSSTLATAREEYDRRRAAGESPGEAALGALSAATGV